MDLKDLMPDPENMSIEELQENIQNIRRARKDFSTNNRVKKGKSKKTITANKKNKKEAFVPPTPEEISKMSLDEIKEMYKKLSSM